MANFGIIVKIQEKNAIVVSEAGLFEMIKYREGMFVGQKVLYNDKDIINKKKKYKYFIPAIAGIAAVFILLMSYFRFFYSDEIYAYIAVDINPSLELMVNEDSIVIDAVAFNEDGKTVLNGIKYRGKLLEKVVCDIIKNSEDQGFIKKEGKEIVLISTAFENKRQRVEKELFNDKLINNFKNEVDKELNDNIDIQLVEVSIDKRHIAREAEVSMGKYLIYEKIKEKGKDIPINVLKLSGLNELIKENGIDIHHLVSENNIDMEKTAIKPTVIPKATPEQTKEMPIKSPETTKVPKTPEQKVTPTKMPAKTPEIKTTPTKIPDKTPEVKVTPTKTPAKTPEAEATPVKTPAKTPEAEATPVKTPAKTPAKTPETEVTPTKTPAKTSEPEVTPIKEPVKTPEPEATPTKPPQDTPVPTTQTPEPAETTTPTPTEVPGGKKSIKIQAYNDNAVSKTDSIYLNIRIYNTRDEEIDLSDVKIRYYYTKDDDTKQKFICDWATVGASNIKADFIEMSSPVDDADTILKISFSDGAGVLKPGKFVRLRIRIFKEDWSHYIQSNDYSFNSSANNFVDWKKITGYISGSLEWGIEP